MQNAHVQAEEPLQFHGLSAAEEEEDFLLIGPPTVHTVLGARHLVQQRFFPLLINKPRAETPSPLRQLKREERTVWAEMYALLELFQHAMQQPGRWHKLTRTKPAYKEAEKDVRLMLSDGTFKLLQRQNQSHIVAHLPLQETLESLFQLCHPYRSLA